MCFNTTLIIERFRLIIFLELHIINISAFPGSKFTHHWIFDSFTVAMGVSKECKRGHQN